MTDHLILVLEAPMSSFGGETIDKRGVIRDFPGRSMLTGLIANALGYDRADTGRLDRLQSRIRHASGRLVGGLRQRDYQTARLFERDAGWTTRGSVEGRGPSPAFEWDRAWLASRNTPAKSMVHQRLRDFDADLTAVVAIGLEPVQEAPDLARVEVALDRPERPLFIGRKPFLPSRPLRVPNRIRAETPLQALAVFLGGSGWSGPVRVQWDPSSEDLPGTTRLIQDDIPLRVICRERLGDMRQHKAGVHSGTREIVEGELALPPRQSTA